MEFYREVEPNGLLYLRDPSPHDCPRYRALLTHKEDKLSEVERKELIEGILEVSRRDTFRRAMVAHGRVDIGEGGLYPLELIFADRATRAARAEVIGKRPPPDCWVHFKRETICKRLGVPSPLHQLFYRVAQQAVRRRLRLAVGV